MTEKQKFENRLECYNNLTAAAVRIFNQIHTILDLYENEKIVYGNGLFLDSIMGELEKLDTSGLTRFYIEPETDNNRIYIRFYSHYENGDDLGQLFRTWFLCDYSDGKITGIGSYKKPHRNINYDQVMKAKKDYNQLKQKFEQDQKLILKNYPYLLWD